MASVSEIAGFWRTGGISLGRLARIEQLIERLSKLRTSSLPRLFFFWESVLNIELKMPPDYRAQRGGGTI